jgi:NTP pyrophosphatase (non-canonical NTP hydrolase)
MKSEPDTIGLSSASRFHLFESSVKKVSCANLIILFLTLNNKSMNAKILEKAIEVYGRDSQIELIIEECSELIFALQKLKRCPDCSAALRARLLFNVRDEIADMAIMVKQAKLIFGAESVNERIDYKMIRLENRLTDNVDQNSLFKQ